MSPRAWISRLPAATQEAIRQATRRQRPDAPKAHALLRSAAALAESGVVPGVALGASEAGMSPTDQISTAARLIGLAERWCR